jgi:hypothetical protein
MRKYIQETDYSTMNTTRYRENRGEIRERFLTGILEKNDIKKIDNLIERTGMEYSYQDIIQAIREPGNQLVLLQEMALIHFAKNPVRQNTSEKFIEEQLNIMKAKGKIASFEKLSISGKNAMYFYNGSVVVGVQPLCNPAPKSIDFVLTLNDGVDLFVLAKRANETGGSQLNNKNDLVVQLVHSIGNKVLVIVDGPYYTLKIREQLKMVNPKAIITSTEELPATIDSI